MNDPYKQQRLDLCKKQTMIHNANCVGCDKLRGLYKSLGDRSDTCNACSIGDELRKIGDDLLKCSRPRNKKMIKVGELFTIPVKQKKKVLIIHDKSKCEEYLALRKQGLTQYDIAKKWGTSHHVIRTFVNKFGLQTGFVKKQCLSKLTVEEYMELKEKHKTDRKICKILGVSGPSLGYFKREKGLTKHYKEVCVNG